MKTLTDLQKEAQEVGRHILIGDLSIRDMYTAQDNLITLAFQTGIDAAIGALPEIEIPEIRTGDYTEHRSYGMASQRRLDRTRLEALRNGL